MIPKLNAIEIIIRSFIHNQTNLSSFFNPLLSLKFGGKLSGANCPGGELSAHSFWAVNARHAINKTML